MNSPVTKNIQWWKIALSVSVLFFEAASVYGTLLVMPQNVSPCNLTIRASFHANTYVTGTKIFVSKGHHFVMECISSSTLSQQAIYRFSLNGTKISTRFSRSKWLPIDSANFSDEGEYSCSASVGNTTCVSSSLFVRVLDAPKMALFPPDGVIRATLKSKAIGAFVNATACLLNPLKAGFLKMFTLRWIHKHLHLNALGASVTHAAKDNCVTLIIKGAGKNASGELILKMINRKTDFSKDFRFSIKIIEVRSPTDSSPSLKPTTSEAPTSQSTPTLTSTIKQSENQGSTTMPTTSAQEIAPTTFSTFETPTQSKKNSASVMADANMLLVGVGICVALALPTVSITSKSRGRSNVGKNTTNDAETNTAMSVDEKGESLAEALPLLGPVASGNDR